MAFPAHTVNFGFGDDEQMLRDLARQFLDEHLPVDELRDLVAGDYESSYERGERPRWDAGLWKQMVELGWSGLAVPEASGGAGFKLAGIAGLIEEIGWLGLSHHPKTPAHQHRCPLLLPD